MTRREGRAAGNEEEAASGPDTQTPAALCELGRRHLEAGRTLDAQLCCQQALATDPGSADAMHLMGLLSLRAEQADHAIEWFARAVQCDQKPAYLLSLGHTLRRQGRLEEAFRALDKAVEIDIESPAAWKALAQLLARLDRRDEAALSFQHVLKLDPENADAAYQAGFLLLRSGKQEEALGFFDRSDRLRANHAPTLQMRALALLLHDRTLFERALSEMARAHALDSDTADLCNDVGDVHRRLGRHEEALTWFDKALKLRPDLTPAHNNKACSLARLHRFDEALAIYAALKATDPDSAEWNEALLQLLLGNFEAGWAGREARWKVPSLQLARYNFSRPMWLGKEPIAGKTILIYHDEGLGDTIQFARYVPMVAAQGARVILMVADPLVPLLSNLPGVIRCVPRSVNQVLAFDTHCGITSLPLAFGTRLETIPSATPYLPAPEEVSVRTWEERLGPRQKLRVGLAWSGNPGHSDDHNRSIPLSTLSPLLDLDATFVSLQTDPRPGDRELLAQTRIVDLTAHLTDFVETAALVSCLDLVITVDTSIAHLAGALACPTWILLHYTPDWRWLLGRDDSPWYPTARLFRQDESRDYAAVIARVQAELRERIASWSPDQSKGRAGPVSPAGAAALPFGTSLSHIRAGNYGEPELASRPVAAPVPDDADSLHLMGLAALHQKQFDQAVEWLSRAIRCDPKPLYLTTLGTTLLSQGRREEALLVFDKAVQLKPDDPELWKNLGLVLVEIGKFADAIRTFQHILQLDPRNWDAAYRVSLLLYQDERYEEALATFNLCAELQPGHFPTIYMRALALQNLKRFEEARADNERAHALEPDSADTCQNMGNVLRALFRHEEAIAWYDKSLALRPNFASTLGNKAVVLAELRRFDEAITTYRQAIAADPADAVAEWNLALLQLLLGDFEAGWPGQEARWKAASLSFGYPKMSAPKWLGAEPIAGKTIVAYANEGFGDTIQFVRYVPLLAARGARVILVVQDSLCALLSGIEGLAQCLPRSASMPPDFDFHVPLSCLPLVFGTRLDTIPAERSYLPAPPAERVREWETRLGAHDKLRVGLVWSGNPNHNNDRNRSIALHRLTRILDLDAMFVSLQKGPRSEDRSILAERHEIVDLTANLTDFVETAALITCLDLVITVDTSVAHLAAAQGCATWILLPYTPDWRWMLDRDDSPWYPTARLFRQDESRDYEGVIERLRSQLAERIEARRAGAPSPTFDQKSKTDSAANARAPAVLCELGHLHLQAGRTRDAEVCCRQALAADPNHAETMHLMGLLSLRADQVDHAIEWFARAVEQEAKPRYLVSLGEALKRQGRVEEAFKAFDRAVEIDIDSAETWRPLAQILADLNRHHEAALAFQHVLKLDPQDADAAYQAGFLVFRAGKPEDALAMIDRADRLRPDHAPTLQVRALVMGSLGRLEEAVAELSRAHALAPDDADICNNMGVFLQRLGRQKDSLAWLIKSLARKPDFDAAYQAGLLLFHSDKPEEALVHLDRADRLRPDHAPTLLARALVIGSLDRFEEAVAELSRAHALAPDDIDICNNMGAFLQRLGRYEEALTWFDRALARKPDFVSACNNKGLTLASLHRFDEALAFYAASRTIDPNNAEAEWSASLLHLLTGNFEAGWAGREARWKVSNQPLARYDLSRPMWSGKQPIDGKTILIYQDEGLGDAIHFVRYLPMLVSLGARVILLVDDALVPLLLKLPGVLECVPKSAHRSLSFDAHCAITSLPLAFNTTLATIPAEVPYLPPPAESRRQIWDRRLGPHSRMRVGLVWSGNPKHRNDRDRSICLRALLPLLDLDATFVSLQKEPRPDDQATLRERPDIVDLTVHLTDLAETAALISCLDLVITVDTSLAHLAGAMACPTWILLPYTPDYRWLLDRDDSPWYPTARLFRQDAARDYGRVIERVRSQLAERTEAWSAGAASLTSGQKSEAGPSANARTPAALCELGHQHLQAGRTLDAQLCCEEALSADSGFAEAMHLMGLLSRGSGQPDHAIEWFARAVQHDQKPAYLLSLGNTLKHQGRLEEAFKVLDKAVEIDIDSPAAWKALAQLLADLNRHHEATLSFQHALKLDPRDADAAYQAGFLLLLSGKAEEALELLDRSNQLAADHAPTLHMRGLVLKNLGRLAEAEDDMARAHALAPDDAEICNDMGVLLTQFGRQDEALTWLDTALKLRPDFRLAHNNKAYALGRLRRFDEALAIYAVLKVANPDDAESDWNAALLHLLTGNFEAGWIGREARWKVPGLPIAKYDFARPMWLGQEPVDGKTILIYQDEGLGDVIQFARYVPMVAAKGARVILLVDDALVPLLSKLSGVTACLPRSFSTQLLCDFYCGISSLPLVFGTRLETIPLSVPYLPVPDPACVRVWEERLGPHEKLRVGLVWSGNPSHKDDHNRSLALRALTPLLDLDAIFVSLQKNTRPADQTSLREWPGVVDLTAHLTDFAETAALMSCLDLVITVDTSIAHLAGALACPTWILLPHTPDWRWLLDRDDSPWYPTARLFRQDEASDYGRVIERVRSQLAERIETWRAGQKRD